MLTFPQLRTGAAVQYPAYRSTQFLTQVLSFLDGSEQRYRLAPGPLHEWIVRLELLDDSELASLEAFVADTQGAFGVFAFTDPKDGHAYPNCSLAEDSIAGVRSAGLRGSTTLTIVENRT